MVDINETGVVTTHVGQPNDDQSWLVNRLGDGIQSVTLDVTTFVSSTMASKCIVDDDPDNTVVYIKSGIPLARITKGANTGLYGPYEAAAKDGRNGNIEGVLESTFSVEFNRTGVKVPTVTAAMRYTGAIDTTKLPVDVTGAKWDGLFVKITSDGSPATLLSNTPAAAGAGA